MGLIDRISRTTEKTRVAQSSFISLRSIYAFLHNQSPDSTSLDIFNSFCLEVNSLDKTPTFYEMANGRPVPVNSNMVNAFHSGFTSFEESGRNLLPNFSSVVRGIEHDPMEHPDAEKYGFMRDDISLALEIDFPAEQVGLRDYESEIQGLKQQLLVAQLRIDELEAQQHQITKPKNPKNEERFAKNREDVLSALIAVINHPEYYIETEMSQKLKKFGLSHQELLQLFKNALPSQEKWVQVMDEKGPRLWHHNGAPPLSRRICEKLLSKAINRLS